MHGQANRPTLEMLEEDVDLSSFGDGQNHGDALAFDVQAIRTTFDQCVKRVEDQNQQTADNMAQWKAEILAEVVSLVVQ